ncbi:protein ABHD18-like [Pecten maximus]|uniref:protein ABHD18-like n=1 Tax=Pecten maximus TaxID=6579 RepID=UPI001458E4A1|nr:protein ABHD18-like [Pecten maximus]XP_033742070.1 protein ABHD18-like [Pecten maximus]
MSQLSKVDAAFRSVIVYKFFKNGWGTPENLKKIFDFRKKISNRDTCKYMVNMSLDKVIIDKEEVVEKKNMKTIEGHFTSPFERHLPGVMPEKVRTAKFKLILPTNWQTENYKPVCLQLAGTGDHGFKNREEKMAMPLLQKGIASLLLENPYYGSRKPKTQTRSFLLHVNDLFVMGAGLTLESLVLLRWCESRGYGPLGITGISLGGHMACLAATNWHKPLVLVPCLSWTTASSVYTRGVLRNGINWKVLESQYKDETEYKEMVDLLTQDKWDLSAYSEGRKAVFDIENPEDLKRGYEMAANYVLNNHSPPEQESIPSSIEEPVGEEQGIWKRTILPAVSSIKAPDISLEPLYQSISDKWMEIGKRDEASLAFMIGVMDECTHLGHYTKPVDQNLIIIVTAKHDGYIPRDEVLGLDKIWPGAEIRYVDGGHVEAYIRHKGVFIKAITDAFDRSKEKFHS